MRQFTLLIRMRLESLLIRIESGRAKTDGRRLAMFIFGAKLQGGYTTFVALSPSTLRAQSKSTA